jgi:hypothetical protein
MRGMEETQIRKYFIYEMNTEGGKSPCNCIEIMLMRLRMFVRLLHIFGY